MFTFIKKVIKTGTATSSYPLEPIAVDKNFRGKPEQNPQQCIGCAACVNACPSNALTVETDLATGELAWEFNLVKDPQVNAFCMPGGKIVVYEGLLTVAQTKDELAVVLGHEIAHAVAKHSNERMSQQIMADCGSQILSSLLSEKSQLTQAAASVVFGLGTQLGVMLPYSRKHEYEADYMGIVFMELAGYDSEASVTFWKKMSSSGGGKVYELLSTHPSDEKRVANLQAKIPEAKSVAQSMRK